MSEIIFSVSVGAKAAVTYTDVITHRNVTFVLDRPMPTVRSCLGEPAVISDQPFNVIAISPASTAVTGSKGAFVAHGAMLDPGDLSGNNAQGYDGLLGQSDGGGQSASAVAYAPTANVDPATNGPLAFAQGATGSVVKSVRMAAVTETSGDWQTIDRYVVLSVLDTVPAEGFFRPGMAPGPKVIYGTEAEVNYDVLHALPSLPGSSSESTALASIKETYPYSGLSNGEKLRRFDLQGGNNYSGFYGLSRADNLAFLHSFASNSRKRVVLLRSIQHGIDIAQAHLASGFTNQGGAGQHYGMSFFSYVAAFALDNTPLLSVAQAMKGGALGQHFWATQSELFEEVDFPSTSSDSHVNESPLLQSDLNIPEWDRQPGDSRRRNAGPGARYRQFSTVGMAEALNVMLLQNGPGGLSGAEAVLQGGAFDETNPAAAAMAYYDRIRPWPDDPSVSGYYGNLSDFLARWDICRPLVTLPLWTGRPDWANKDGRVTGSDGQIIYDWSGFTWATEPITRRDIRYSLDGRQYMELQDVPGSGALSNPLRGVAHFVGFRLVSASGPGRWSPNYPSSGPLGNNANPRNLATPTGSETAAAPVNTVAPLIMIRHVENWGGSDMIDAGSVFTPAQRDDDVVLYAGLGYWSGFPALSFSYQWRLNGADIAGETGDHLDPKNRFDLSQGVITCAITADNGTAQVTAVTQAITLPEILPPGPFVADFTLGDASAGFFGSANVALNYGAGALQVMSNGSFQGASTPELEVVHGQSYRVDVDVDNTSSGSLDVTLGTTALDDNVLSGSATRISSGNAGRITETITAPGDVLFIKTRLRGNGGGSTFRLLRVILTPL